MNFAEATQALLATVVDLLVSNAVAAPDAVVLDNELFDPTVEQVWVKVSVNHREAQQHTLGPPGSRRFRYSGQVIIRSYVAVSLGTAPSANVVDLFSPLAGNRLVDSLVLGAPLVMEGVREGAWHVSAVHVPFEYEQVL